MRQSIHRVYKTLIFFQPELEKDMIIELLKKYYKILNKTSSKFTFQNLGTKLLAYPIKGFSSATYIQIQYIGNGELVKEVNKQLSISENIIRYVTIQK